MAYLTFFFFFLGKNLQLPLHLFSSPYSEIKNTFLKPRKQLETAHTVNILYFDSGMSAKKRWHFQMTIYILQDIYN